MGDAKTIAEGLRKIRARLTPEGAWTQGAFARTDKGRVIGPLQDNACSWCLAGANIAGPQLRDAPTALGFRSDLDLVVWNDAPKRKHKQVLARLDRRIAHFEATP